MVFGPPCVLRAQLHPFSHLPRALDIVIYASDRSFRYVLLRLRFLLAGSMPGINNLLSMIKTRRRRDAVIVGSLIGLCTVLLLMYMF